VGARRLLRRALRTQQERTPLVECQ
jgi:hypothetical protein